MNAKVETNILKAIACLRDTMEQAKAGRIYNAEDAAAEAAQITARVAKALREELAQSNREARERKLKEAA